MTVEPEASSGRAASPAGVGQRVEILALAGLPEVHPGDALVDLIVAAVGGAGLELRDHDVVVVAHKIVSKAEKRIVRLSSVRPGRLAREWAERNGRDARQVQVVLDESVRIVRMDRDVMVCETRHGFVCANAGVDASNAPAGSVLLLPEDPDRSARRLRTDLLQATGAHVGVVVTDTWGRPWRLGITNVAIGASGLPVMSDHRGEADPAGRLMRSTVVATADEVAGAAELVMGKTSRIPAAIVRGLDLPEQLAADGPECSAASLVRPAEDDLFR
jgi:coenzyme F420-0:L-glutamate ligase/coenzyme F420-1:gamma-L-glutamate ligase